MFKTLTAAVALCVAAAALPASAQYRPYNPSMNGGFSGQMQSQPNVFGGYNYNFGGGGQIQFIQILVSAAGPVKPRWAVV